MWNQNLVRHTKGIGVWYVGYVECMFKKTLLFEVVFEESVYCFEFLFTGRAGCRICVFEYSEP